MSIKNITNIKSSKPKSKDESSERAAKPVCSLKKHRKLIIEIVTLIILVVVFIISFLVDFSIIKLPDHFIMRVDDVEGLLFTLFTIQASVAAISIAVVSIITSVLNDTVYGISVSQYITSIKQPIFKHHILIISSLCVIAINYFCVSYTWYNMSIAIFVLSILINIKLVSNVSIVFSGKENIRIDILNYLRKKYNSESISALTKETLSAIETSDSMTVKENFEAYKIIFGQEIVKSNYTESDLTNKILHGISDVFAQIVRLHDSRKANDVLLFICDIYDIANRNAKPLYLKLWEYISSDYITALKDLSYEQLQEGYVYCLLRKKLYYNLHGLEEDKRLESSIKFYSAWVYNALLSNKDRFTQHESRRISKNIYDHVATNINYTSESSKAIRHMYMEEMCFLHKQMIFMGHCDEISELFFDKTSYLNKNIENDTISIVTLAYLYYLSSRETIIDGTPLQKNAIKILNNNKNSISYFYLYNDIYRVSKENYQYIQQLMRHWEAYNENDFKTLIIDGVIFDFFVFTILTQYWNSEHISDSLELILPSGLFSIYNRYFAEEDAITIKEQYKKYCDLFGETLTEQDANEKIDLLHTVLANLYKKEEIANAQKNSITPQKITDMEERIRNKVLSIVQYELDKFTCEKEHIDSDIDEIILDNDIILNTTILSLDFGDDEFNNHISEALHSAVIEYFLRNIFKYIDFQEVYFKSKNKQETLINMVRNLGIDGDIVIGCKDRQWNEDDKLLLNSFTADMTRIKYPNGYNYCFILDSKLIDFSVSNIKIETSDISLDMIKEKCRKDKSGNMCYRITNDLYIPFDETELTKFVNYTKKLFTVTADIKYRLYKNKVGAGIQIVTKLTQ